ncbi:MAG: hypothetical protein JWM33_2310, partial [Caulobacteraceae bacterium]|nr:hypothetical protein [Caulobacteraceae bacterium]
WKVTDADTTLWILATPDAMHRDSVFNDCTLHSRVAHAREVIVPKKVTGAQLGVVPGDILYPLPSEKQLVRPPPQVPLEQRLPPELLQRLRQRVELGAADSPDPFLHKSKAELESSPVTKLSTLQIAAGLADSLHLEGWPNWITNVPAEIAANNGAKVTRLHDTAAEAVLLLNRGSEAEPSEAVQQQCLSMVLDMLDAGWAGSRRLVALDAWASGDVNRAMMRSDVMTVCTAGTPLGVRFWSVLVGQYMSAIKEAMDKPGQVVAVVEFDPLLIRNGVLDQLKSLYTVTGPEVP